jgi:hypothetical protein
MSENRTPGIPGQDTDPTTSTTAAKPEGERDLVAEVTETLAAVDASMPRVERAAHYREMMSSLRRAASAAKLLSGLTPEEASDAEPEEEDEGPITEPSRPTGGSLAWLSDGSVALSVHYVEGADLSGYARWEGIVLSREQAEEVLDGLSDAADDVGANVGGAIRWKKDKGNGGDGDE